jgi:hypothetical protein
MAKQSLKLKQASAVLDIQPKELQNLVQFGVVKPKRSQGTYWFDASVLLAAKVAFSLKEDLRIPTTVLSEIMGAFFESKEELRSESPKYIVFLFHVSIDDEPIKLSVPLRAFAEQIEERMKQIDLFRDLPRGRKRRGWKKEFLESLADAARDIGDVSEKMLLRTVSSYRRERRAPEITVVAES